MTRELGRLKAVELRTVWEREDTGFTPWLAQPENIHLLGETVGIKLEVLEQEANVGPFRADILCQDTLSGAMVLIENQIEATDHTHLGQLMTYAAGLDAVRIIWIAARFSEEHRAALDWLNGITQDDFHFFGIEVELWKIGDSAPAPRFHLVSKPNEWTKSVRKGAQSPGGPGEDLKQIYGAYWQNFHIWASENAAEVRFTGGGRIPMAWFEAPPLAKTLFASLLVRDGHALVCLTLKGSEASAQFDFLQERRAEIEEALGSTLEWAPFPSEEKASIYASQQVNFENPASWSASHAWIVEQVARFRRVFGEHLNELGANG